MCGITGFWNFSADETGEAMQKRITAMANSMYSRGPDSGGVWIAKSDGLALGHRRLAIVDLSAAGHQPMTTPDGRYVICYNGEVYDAAPMKAGLEAEGVRFTGTSDTEVLLHGCARYGIVETVSQLAGMFAFAFLDRKEKKLTLIRDRLGIKPLYWARIGGLFLFGSELKSIRAYGGLPLEINRDAIAGVVDNCYIPGPLSVYRDVFKLQPGHLLTVDSTGAVHDHCWWNALDVLRASRKDPVEGGDEELTDQLEVLLRKAVGSRMIADVPLGAFLSGGVDSSTVVALMQTLSDKPVRTFSIGFNESEYNEAPYAKAVARHLGTLHTEQYLDASEAWELIPSMPEYYDEPFADSSQLPTYLLSKITREYVTTALSGDGGDELFCGYGRYFGFMSAFRHSNRPAWQQRLIRFAGERFSEQALNAMFRIIPAPFRPADPGGRIKRKAARLAADPLVFYRKETFAHWPDPEGMVPGSKLPARAFETPGLSRDIPDSTVLIQFLDAVNYLPDDILVKVDRASMAVSLEARVPLIDHRVYEFAWRLPPRMRVRDGKGKWILRNLLSRYVPNGLIDRPKMGFGVPIDDWLRGPLREWAGELLDPGRLKRDGYFVPEIVVPIWKKQLAGENHQYWLWEVLMVQAWLERAGEKPRIADADIVVEFAA